MTGFLDLVKKRRSVRRYSNKPIERELIDQCIEAARLAPSACNSQPWTFVVVDDEKLKAELSKKAFSGIYAINRFAADAPVLVIVVTERSGFIARLGQYFTKIQYALIDIGIACEHLVLQAAEIGIGSCYLGWFNEKALRKLLKIPGGSKVDLIISLGYHEGGDGKELWPASMLDRNRHSIAEIRKFNSYS